jgi:hypothetical protein
MQRPVAISPATSGLLGHVDMSARTNESQGKQGIWWVGETQSLPGAESA